jgi:flagellar biosynthetic protein FliQ
VNAFADLLRETMVLCAALCVPVLFVAALAGLIVAVAQAATQVQEQTLSVLPKILAIGGMLALFGSGGLRACAGLFHDAIAAMPAIIYGQ